MVTSGVVILNYNTTETIINFSKEFKNYKNVDHFVIVDNNSTDNLFDKLEQIKDSKIDVIKSEKNGGYAYGNNLGAKFLIDKYNVDVVYIINPDMYFTNENMLKMNEAFQKYQEYALIGAKNSDMNGKYNRRQFWKIPYFKDEIFDCFYLTRLIKKKKEVYFISDDAPEVLDVEVVPGCFWGIRADILKDIEFLDENTFLYYEENILAQKLKRKKYKAGILTTVTLRQDRNNSSTNEINKNGKNHEYTVDSKKYYQKSYLNLSKIKLKILDICMKYSFFEKKIILMIKKWR